MRRTFQKFPLSGITLIPIILSIINVVVYSNTPVQIHATASVVTQAFKATLSALSANFLADIVHITT
jgi:hypothetical protein